jgi:hypothetical protein
MRDFTKPGFRGALPLFLSLLLVTMPVLADDVPPEAPQTSAAPAAQTPAAPAPQPPAGSVPAAPGAQAPAPAALPMVEGLKVLVLAGKDEVNDIQRRVMAPLVVEVLDQNDRPVQNAEVVFRFPLQGPSATFPAGKTSVTARTNGQGQAAALNWIANNEVGRFDVHVNASYGNQIGQVTFSMSNANNVPQSTVGAGTATEKHGGWFSPTWVKIAVIGGAAAIAAGVFLATRGGSKSAAPAGTVTISPGSPTIGGPH